MFMLHVNRKGTHYEIDSKGRILISQSLKDKAQLDTEVEIIGLNDHLEIWSKKSLDDILDQNPLTEENFERISDLKSGREDL
jgi:MraZ protein